MKEDIHTINSRRGVQQVAPSLVACPISEGTREAGAADSHRGRKPENAGLERESCGESLWKTHKPGKSTKLGRIVGRAYLRAPLKANRRWKPLPLQRQMADEVSVDGNGAQTSVSVRRSSVSMAKHTQH